MRALSAGAACVLLLAACATDTSGSTTTMDSGAEMTFLALGDDYVVGEGAAVSDSWPVQLTVAARGRGIRLADPRVVAATGWTTVDLVDAVADLTGSSWDLVAVQVGVNDQVNAVDGFAARAQALIMNAVDLARGDPTRVLVVSIPDWGVTRYGETFDQDQIAVAVDVHNAELAAAASAAGVEFVDVTETSRDSGHLPEMQAADGLHPSGAHYRQWLEPLLAALTAAMDG